MVYQSLLKDRKYRISASLMAGIFFKFFTDIIFGLLYKNYEIWQPLWGYLQAIGLSFLVVECFYRLEIRLNNSNPWQKSVIRRFFIQLGLEVLLIFGMFILLRWIIFWAFYKNALVIVTDELILTVSVISVALIYNVINLGSFLLFQWRDSLAEMERFKKEIAESRFEALRNQVNPHFLFNSLNTLSSLMYENIDLASVYIRQLSQVYRYVLENREKELVTLKQELEFLEAYQYLLELRFANRIVFKHSIEDKYYQWFIAPMTLQILYENAMKHNEISTKKPLQIEMIVKKGRLTLSNNLQLKTSEGYSSGMGLKNIESRYRFLTSNPVDVAITEDTFSVSIPLIEQIVNP